MIQKNITAVILSVLGLLLFGCKTEGGIWLGEGENYGRSYVFGTATEIENLKGISLAYSEQDTEKLITFYNQEFLGENGAETTDQWLQSMESISMKPYKIIPLHSKDGSLSKFLLGQKKNVFIKTAPMKSWI